MFQIFFFVWGQGILKKRGSTTGEGTWAHVLEKCRQIMSVLGDRIKGYEVC